jgi:hypothetical protein
MATRYLQTKKTNWSAFALRIEYAPCTNHAIPDLRRPILPLKMQQNNNRSQPVNQMLANWTAHGSTVLTWRWQPQSNDFVSPPIERLTSGHCRRTSRIMSRPPRDLDDPSMRGAPATRTRKRWCQTQIQSLPSCLGLHFRSSSIPFLCL